MESLRLLDDAFVVLTLCNRLWPIDQDIARHGITLNEDTGEVELWIRSSGTASDVFVLKKEDMLDWKALVARLHYIDNFKKSVAAKSLLARK